MTRTRSTPLTRFFVRDTIQTVTDMLSDGIRKLFRKEFNTILQAQHRSRPRSFSNSNGWGRDRSRRRSPSRRRSCWGQSLVPTSAAGPRTGRLLYITDRKSRLRFLVDTGSEVSIIPPSKSERINQQDTFGLLVANNSPIVTYRTRSLTLNLGLRHTCRRRLVDTRSQLSVQGVLSSSPSASPTLLPKKPSNDLMAIMAEFPTITQQCSKDHPIKQDITYVHPRRLVPEWLKIARQQFEHMLEIGNPHSVAGHLCSKWWLKSQEIGIRAVTIER